MSSKEGLNAFGYIGILEDEHVPVHRSGTCLTVVFLHFNKTAQAFYKSHNGHKKWPCQYQGKTLMERKRGSTHRSVIIEYLWPRMKSEVR